MILLDTHVLVWMDCDDPRVGERTRHMLLSAWRQGQVAVSPVTFWECAMLHARGRIELSGPPVAWRGELLAAGLVELSLDGAISILAVGLKGLHKDPVDRFIAATALYHSATLITADARLLHWRDDALICHDATR